MIPTPMLLGSSLLAVSLTLAPAAGAAPPATPGFGKGASFNLEDLPPGQLRTSLEELPALERSKALQWLHRFSFPGADADALRADSQGGILYVDAYHPEPAETESSVTAEPVSAVDPNTTFMLHSKPSATQVVYLDFDGHLIENTAWNANGLASYSARPFDPNGNTGFDDDELARIAEIWHRVAEDLAPFDIDVTTEDPIDFGPDVGRVLVTHNQDANGNAMPYASAGGVAYVDVYGRSDYEYYSPALVYYNNLGSGFAPYVAEASAHEFGHNLGLSHDGTSTESYYSGHGSDSSLVSWAPIMGLGYYKNVTQWSQGEYLDANNPQDDLAIIANDLGYRVDDHGNDAVSATALLVDDAGVITATNPETDAFNDSTANKGIIETRSDVDVFYFDADAGDYALSVLPAWTAFERASRRGANMDVLLTLRDEAGQVVASSDPLDDTRGDLLGTLAGGRYYLEVAGVGNVETPYSDYNSAGQYFISGSITPATDANQAPVADFTYTCTDLSCGFADASSDADGSVVAWDWDFGDGNTASVQHPSHNYASAGTYSVTLVVTDDLGATASVIQTLEVTADTLQPPAVPDGLTAVDNADGTAGISWNAVADASAYDLQREKLHKNGRWIDATSIATGLETTSYIDTSGQGTFRYSVRAINAAGASDWSAWVSVTVTGGSDGGGGNNGGGNGGGGGKDKDKCHPRDTSC